VDTEEFRAHAHALVDWMADYLSQIESFPVRSPVRPRDILSQIPVAPPSGGEPFDLIFEDFRRIILPGMTHWQHPSFFAYFPANSSPPSVLAEMLTATIGAQCMSWVTSPAATELEERMIEWLRQMTGLPEAFGGVIQDTASTATLCSLLTAREVHSDFHVNQRGFENAPRFTTYCSTETHSSIEKDVKIAGLGRDYLRKIPVGNTFAMRVDALEEAITRDLTAGLTPLCVVATLGTTGSTAIDPLRAIGELCRTYNIWLHVDAAFAGSALILPEMRWIADGIELADTFVFNPHKWLMTNFDCSAYFVKDTTSLVRTFEILPEYLKSSESERIKNYRDWGIQLGRRFRALKLWFVLRSYGVEGLQEILRAQIRMAQGLADVIRSSSDFELLAPVSLNLVCFRYHPPELASEELLDSLNATLLETLNATGKLYLTHTKLNSVLTLRLVVGQAHVEQRHVRAAWSQICDTARSLPR
jgi:aromatic-L-amino-acid decarboxylase